MPKGVTNNLHLHFTAEVFLIYEGSWRFRWGANGEHQAEFVAQEGSVISVPANSWRRYRALDGEMEATLTTQGDHRKKIYWDAEIIEQALERDSCLDPDGYVATASILPATARRAGENIARAL